ncbi:Hint domain-containing protein [Paracoccus sp. (in: a-proteobacteria)]|uniref:Hint domain-containing protein n=1 Tax=Paracoccus sp. TaxID=267 RepID=UPI002896B9B4|nr:Hint domain-containing protein [Paracoccus sp. (in: a-proteobacteria)]
MSYIFKIDGATVGQGPEGASLDLPGYTSFGDFAEAKRSVDEFNVQDDDSGSKTLTTGDFVAPIVGGVAMPSTYWGQGTISFDDVGVNYTGGQYPGLDMQFQIAPVSGGLVSDADGGAYFIVDNDYDIANHPITGTIVYKGETVQVNTTYGGLADAMKNLFPGTPNLGMWLSRNVPTVVSGAVPNSALDPDAAFEIDESEIGDIVCFAAGTLIETLNGEVAIEMLSVGDSVLTKDNGAQAIRWISSTKVSAAALAKNPKLRPIRIAAGALGNNTPAKDLLVSPYHRVLIRSAIAQRMFGAPEVLVAAKQLLLIDGVDVAHDLAEVTYYHMLFDRHEVVMSNGAETESLFTGPEALKTIGAAAAEEVFSLFPELRDASYTPVSARNLLSGRSGRKLVTRHIQHQRALVM